MCMWKMCLLAEKRKTKKSKFLGFLLRLCSCSPCNSGSPLFSSGLCEQLFLFAFLLQSAGMSLGLALGVCFQR